MLDYYCESAKGLNLLITKELVDRINELSKKQRSEGLTEQEKIEQAECRRKYIDAFKANVKRTLDNIERVSPEEYAARMKERQHSSDCDCGHCHHDHHLH
jgi:uncharacterized protein YnzC (UPF0291/DUF896 family)